jgi:hypothetical protein
VKIRFVIFIKIFYFLQVFDLKTNCPSLRDSFGKERVKMTERKTGEGPSSKYSSQWRYYHQVSFLTVVFTRRNTKNNIRPPDVDTIVVDVNEDT